MIRVVLPFHYLLHKSTDIATCGFQHRRTSRMNFSDNRINEWIRHFPKIPQG